MEVHTVCATRFLSLGNLTRPVLSAAPLYLDPAQSAGDDRLLTRLHLRCFGDKGDVEDITEGKPAVPLQTLQLLPLHFVLTYFTADIISTVEFDHTGNYLATGDKGGRVVLFERNETVCAALYFCSLEFKV